MHPKHFVQYLTDSKLSIESSLYYSSSSPPLQDIKSIVTPWAISTAPVSTWSWSPIQYLSENQIIPFSDSLQASIVVVDMGQKRNTTKGVLKGGIEIYPKYL